MTAVPVPAARPLALLALSIEDERELYGEFLNFSGFQVEFALTADEAIRAAASRKPAIVIVNYRIPGSGPHVYARLKENAATAHIPVLMIASSQLDQPCGCESVLFRPVAPDDLVKAARRLIGREPRSTGR